MNYSVTEREKINGGSGDLPKPTYRLASLDGFRKFRDAPLSVEAVLDGLGVEYGSVDLRGELPHQCFHDPDNHTHGDRDFSASSNVETGQWYCHVCCVGG